MKEVERKITELKERKRDGKLEKYLAKEEKFAPIIIGPGGIPYIVDHHHLARALQDSGLRTEMNAVVVENWSTMSKDDFWTEMKQHHYCYLKDNGTDITPDKLPDSLAKLGNDMYRSLAWRVRDEGGFEKTSIDYSEFEWADFFRPRIQLTSDADIELNVKRAKELAQSADAEGLPGYSPSGAEAKTRYGDGKLTKIEYWFHTTSNDKDWDTEVVANVYYNGRLVAGRSCCSSDKRADHWNDWSNSPTMELPLSDPEHEQITMKELADGSYKVGIRAGKAKLIDKGNDKWEFDAELKATFSDDRHLRWTWTAIGLESKQSRFTEREFGLSTGH